MKRWLKLALRLLVSVGLLWYVLSKTELSAIADSMRSVDWIWLLAAFISLFIGKIWTGYRWQKLLEAHGLRVPLRLLVNSLFVGQFFNSFLPSTVGGDAVRAYDTAVYSRDPMRSVTAVFVDRLIGVFALVLLGVVAIGVGIWLNADVAAYTWLIIASLVICVVAIIVVFDPTLAAHCEALLNRFKLPKVANKVRKASKALLALRAERHLLWISFVVSLLLQLNVVMYYYFCALALNINVPLIYFFLFTPIVLIILLVPFSINGIGLRESAYVFFLGMVGIGASDAIAFSWLSFGLMLSHGVIGGIVFALRDASLRQLKMDAMLSKSDSVAAEN